MKTDPLQQAPDFDITPQDLLRETLALLESSRNIRDHITGSITPSKAIFENVIIPLAEDENNTADRLKTFVFLGSVSTEPNLREASRQAEKLIARSEAEFLTREDVFKLIDSVFEKHQNLRTEGRAELDAESGYLLQRKHQEYLQNGLRIPAGPQRERFMTARAELDDLLTAARKSLSEVDDGIWFLRKDLVGVPDTSLATMEESKEDPNKIWVTFRKPHFIAIMQNCANSITRKRMWVAKENRFLDNVDRLKKIIVLRDEIARLLGFTNHAELKMTEKMARSVERVLTELMQLRTKLAPLAQIEIERASELKMRDLASRKTESSHGDASKLHLWDWSFYDRMLKNENYSFNSAIVAEYFEVMHTMKQMLGIFEQLFGMRFEEVQDDAWEKDVIIFTVWNDESGGSCFLGRLYLDLFLRKGKYDGASHHMIQPGYTDTHGTRHFPSSALICNFTKPSSSRPTLLRHNEVRTFFHELGHCIHNIVSRTTYSSFHGTHVARDFIEIPSIMLESWIWVPDVLKKLGRHYSYLSEPYREFWRLSKNVSNESAGDVEVKTEEAIPDSLIKDLVKTKSVNGAVEMLKQIHLALFDLAIHMPSSHHMAKEMDISRLWNDMRDEIVGLASSADDSGRGWGAGQAGFPHVFRKYDAGYFAYPLSKVCASDLFFTAFKEDPMEVLAGKRYRSIVLEPGSSRPEAETLELFLGRKPNGEAYYSELCSLIGFRVNNVLFT